MADRSIDDLARALTADRYRAVDPEALAAADPDELAAALRRVVAGLPPAEQRTRLAAAFRTITTPSDGAVVASPDAYASETQPRPPSTNRSFVSMRHLTPVRAGLLAAALLGSLIGALVGAVTDEDEPERVAVPAAAQDPVPVLEPIATGEEPPSAEAVAALFPPDAEVQAAAEQRAIEEHPELADVLDDGEDESDDHSDASIAATVGRLTGYADAAAVFDRGSTDGGGDAVGDEEGSATSRTTDSEPDATVDGSSSTTATDEDSGGVGTDGGTGDGGAGDGDGAPGGDAPADEPLGVIDLCAGDEPPGGCEGVAGTVTLMTVPAFRLVVEPMVTPFWPACGVDGVVADDEFAVMLMTNNLGDFTVRYRAADSTQEFREISGSSPDAWRAYRDGLDDSTEPVIVTCLVAQRAGPERRLELDITGTGDQDSGPVRWTGVRELGAGTEVAPRRDGRPAVTVEALTASELLVTVPIGVDEHAAVSLVPREEAVGDCGARPVASGAARPDLPESPFAPPDIEDLFDPPTPSADPLHADWSYQRFDLSAPTAGAYLVCVDWLDGFDPPRNLEKASIPVDIAGISSAELVLAGYEASAGASIQPDRVVVEGHVGVACGSATVGEDDPVLRSDPAVVCRFDSVPVRIGVATRAEFDGGSPVPGRAMIDVEECELTGHWTEEPSCTSWYAVTVLGPDGAVSGVAVIGVRVRGYHGADSAFIGAERSEYTDEPEITGPRLRWDMVSAEPAPDDPSRAAIVRWATDVPARVNVVLTPIDETDHCTGRTSPPSELGPAGERRFDGLCPGIDYYVSFDARGEAGRTYSGIYADHADLPAEGVDLAYRSLLLRTAPLTVEYDYELTFAETSAESFRGSTPGASTDQGLVPRDIRLALPADGDAQRYEFSQYYDGHAYFGLDCALPAHYDRSVTGVPLTVRGGRFVPVDAVFTFSTYLLADDGCPDFMQQARGSALDRAECTVHIDGLQPVDASNDILTMLEGRPAVFRATASTCPSGTRQFEAQLTVRMREVRTLRGG